MENINKENLINSIGIRIGYIYKLTGKIGYVTETKAFQAFQACFEKIKEEYKSEVLVLDVTNLKRWDTLSLKVIFPTLIQINNELLAKSKPLISIIGTKSTDIFDASLERHRESGTSLVPWYESLDEFLKNNSL